MTVSVKNGSPVASPNGPFHVLGKLGKVVIALSAEGASSGREYGRHSHTFFYLANDFHLPGETCFSEFSSLASVGFFFVAFFSWFFFWYTSGGEAPDHDCIKSGGVDIWFDQTLCVKAHIPHSPHGEPIASQGEISTS